ncbi:UDP-N-acetylmuramyl pentapeptide phosphotransferase [Brevibacillus sp. SIMBA_040]|uniref:UDP-N-acetylmuramyl pentapeptide phosphotransferase n=1 Tax=unclassified Brevibacillus TaxID=2684853 RepID=UPI00397BC26D
METKWMIGIAVSIGLPILLHLALLEHVTKKLKDMGMQRVNYRGAEVLTAGGIMVVASSTLTMGALLLCMQVSGIAPSSLNHGLLLMAGMITLAVWGWQDDRATDEPAKGFRGHLGALWRERKVTSGLWKAWGGGSTALLISLAFAGTVWTWLLAVCLLAITPNVLNLFDMRPARALKVFWLLLVIVGVAAYYFPAHNSSTLDWVWFLPVLTSSILLFRHDASGKIMLGDTGANSLGFVIGYAFVTHTSVQVQLLILVFFIGLHVMAEFMSFTQLIERISWLKRMDGWGRSAESE